MRSVPAEAVDADSHSLRRAGHPARQWDLVLAVAAGGVVGAESRYGFAELVPHSGRQFPWATLLVNAVGCLVIGALMVLLLELTSPHRLARPFLGVGILGGFTTFSTFSVDAVRLVDAHRPLLAVGYVVATALLCLVAVFVGTAVTQQVGRVVVDRRARRGKVA